MGAATPLVIEYITLDNVANGFPQRPRVPSRDLAFMADLERALAGLPQPVLKLLERKLAGVLLVEDLGGTGYTDEIRDAAGKPVAAFVVLDAGVLRGQRANAWISWREGTPFKPAPDRQLRARIAAPRDDDRVHAIQYILLHELAHVVAVGERFHPSWTEPAPASLDGYAFAAVSWQVAGGRYRPQPPDEFAQRERVVYYFGPRLEAAEMAATYAALRRTRFATLYAATVPGDDFAEAFANFVHVVLLGRPFAIELLEDGKVRDTYGPCWDEPRCAPKRRLLETLLR